MQGYIIIDRTNGAAIEADGATVERLIGVEIDSVDWAISQDGKFENAEWVVTRNAQY